MNRSIAAIAVLFAWSLGCAPTEEVGPPPFNAIDPSLQCPAGQVGWDFSTGGNESDVVVLPVGGEIKVQEAVYSCYGGTERADLTNSFRISCDNNSKCERSLVNPGDPTINCAQRSLSLKYKCGNEPTVYDISRRYYHPNHSSQYIVGQPTTPADTKVVLTCGEQIKMRGMAFQLRDGSYSAILEENTGCAGTRRCYRNDVRQVARSGIGRVTHKYYYTCGKGSSIREFVAHTDQYVDFYCPVEETPQGEEPPVAVFVKELRALKSSAGNEAKAKQMTQALKEACDGKRSCSYVGPELGYEFGDIEVEYWCGSTQHRPEKKYFNVETYMRNTAEKRTISLRCGGRLRIVDASQPWAATACPPGVRVCSIPPGTVDTRFNFFCEGLSSPAPNTYWLRSSANYARDYESTRSLECPIEENGLGITLVGRCFKGNCSEKPQLEEIAQCQNKINCLINRPINGYGLKYTCSGTGETKESTEHTIDGKAMTYLDCNPKPKITGIDGCINVSNWRYLNCKDGASSGCDFDLSFNNGFKSELDSCSSGVNVRYRCGTSLETQTKALKTGDWGPTYNITLECPYDPNPRPAPSTKKCIANYCPAHTARNATMDCEPDSTIPVVWWHYAWSGFANPGTWPGLTTVKEGFPYDVYSWIWYPGWPRFGDDQTSTIWAYDVFKRKDNTGPEVHGFRCVVSAGSVAGHVNPYVAFTRGQAAVLPSDCFKDSLIGDTTGSWYHGSRMVGVSEAVFRNEYRLVHTNLATSFDVRGRAGVYRRNAPNPIGFYYKPDIGYVDQYSFYAQTRNPYTIAQGFRFEPSRRIEITTLSGQIDQSILRFGLDAKSPRPTLEVNFKWMLRGDSVNNPFSPNSRLASNAVVPLQRRNLRATLEVAKVRTGAANLWTPENSGAVAVTSLGSGNPTEVIERLTAQFNDGLISRMLTVRGTGQDQRSDGWMDNNIEINSAFQARVCLDFDGLVRAPGETAIDNRYVTATRDQTTFELGFTKRCSNPVPFVVIRDLFKKPVIPINAAEGGVGKGNTTNQGGSVVGTQNDLANEGDCRTQCSVNADCGPGGTCDRPGVALGYCRRSTEALTCHSKVRSGMATSGQFGRSFLSTSSNNTTVRGAAAPQVYSSSRIELVGFKVLDSSDSQTGNSSSNYSEVELSLGRTWASVAAVGELVQKLQKNANPKPVKPWYKPSLSTPFSKSNPVPGIAFGISASGYLTVGPVPIHLEVSASVSLGFDLKLKLISDRQSVTAQSNPLYPCLGTTACRQLINSAKTFKEASEDCIYRGGTLVEIKTATDLTQVRQIAGNNSVWIGAQASHIFNDPKCADLSQTPLANVSSRMASCKNGSVTRYQWIQGDGIIADSQSSGALFNQSEYLANHGFGSGLTYIRNENASPLGSGLLLKSNGALESHRATNKISDSISVSPAPTTALYICQYEPANRYDMSEVVLTPSLEVSAGVSASACVPSSFIGACAVAEFKFVTAGVSLDMGIRRVNIYDSPTVYTPKKSLGTNYCAANWEVAFLKGGIGVEIRYFFGSKNFEIVKYGGVASYGGELFSTQSRYRK